jgi:hypothetical protein
MALLTSQVLNESWTHCPLLEESQRAQTVQATEGKIMAIKIASALKGGFHCRRVGGEPP